jgi:hypothetical protein
VDNQATRCQSTRKAFQPLQVGKWYAEIGDDGAAGVLYQCIERDGDTFVMADESDDEPRYISGRSATTEFWIPQL